jgi:hypothetical protein
MIGRNDSESENYARNKGCLHRFDAEAGAMLPISIFFYKGTNMCTGSKIPLVLFN